MPPNASLDDVIGKKAGEFAKHIRNAAAVADKEEEIRIETEKQLAFIQKEAGIKLEAKHEYTVASGRVDSVYSRAIYSDSPIAWYSKNSPTSFNVLCRPQRISLSLPTQSCAL
jgi:hypothetical protein